MQLVAFTAFANEQQKTLNVKKRKHDQGPAAAPTQDPVLEACHGEFVWLLRGLTRELMHTVAAAARRETAPQFTFSIHFICLVIEPALRGVPLFTKVHERRR
jgi:hypothetical protein